MKKKLSRFIICFIILDVLWGCAHKGQEIKHSGYLSSSYETSENQRTLSLYLIKLYKDYISSADGDRCPMYPTCSQYCIDAFKKHGSLMGWIMCSDRLMRCGRDEMKLSAPVWINGEKHTYDPLSRNDFWWQ